MEPLKDNKMWRRLLSVAFGFAFVVWGTVSIFTGRITAIHGYNHTFFAKREPVGFWAVVSLVIYLGTACIYRGIRGKK